MAEEMEGNRKKVSTEFYIDLKGLKGISEKEMMKLPSWARNKKVFVYVEFRTESSGDPLYLTIIQLYPKDTTSHENACQFDSPHHFMLQKDVPQIFKVLLTTALEITDSIKDAEKFFCTER